jgi:hypothetical protein
MNNGEEPYNDGTYTELFSNILNSVFLPNAFKRVVLGFAFLSNFIDLSGLHKMFY